MELLEEARWDDLNLTEQPSRGLGVLIAWQSGAFPKIQQPPENPLFLGLGGFLADTVEETFPQNGADENVVSGGPVGGVECRVHRDEGYVLSCL